MKTTCISILFLYLSLCSLGQNITIDKIPLSDKLPVSAIYRVFQDSEGYMWYGTVDGLCRDDGYNLQVFRSNLDNPDLLENNTITAIAEDKENKIWFGTDDGAYILDKATYKIHPIINPAFKGRTIACINSASDGSMWISVPGGLYQYLPDETLINVYPLHVDGRNATIHSFIEDREHNLLVSVWEKGIYRLNKESHAFQPYSSEHSDAKMTCIIQDKEKPYFWVGTMNQGIIRFDPTASPDSMYVRQPLPINSIKETEAVVYYIVQDDIYGYLWVTSYTDLFVFEINEKGMLKQIDTSTFLPLGNKNLYEIIKGKDGNLWVSAYDQESFIINFQHDIVDEYPLSVLRNKINGTPAIVALCKDERDIFWLVQERIGLCVYDAERNQLKAAQNLGAIYQLCKSHKKGRVWVVPYTRMIYGMSQQNLSLQIDETIDLSRINPDAGNVRTLYEDLNGNLWIGTTSGLFVYRTNTKQIETVCSSTSKVSGITETADGLIWACTENNGIYRVEKNGSYLVLPFLNKFRCVDVTSDGKLWLGTEQGIVLFYDPVTNLIEDYSSNCGMNGNIINKIIVDMYNHVWIDTNQKLTEFNPQNGAYRNYLASEHRLLLNRFLPNAAYKDQDKGILYFGGIAGFISLKPSNTLESIPRQDKSLITNITILGRSLFFDHNSANYHPSAVEFSPGDRNVEIFFSSLNHQHAKHIRYAYRLNGVDNEWVYVGDGKNSAFYNQLHKGKYTFQVKATDENGLWSNEITEITITRLPAFYETTWAYIVYFLSGLSIIYTILNLYLQRKMSFLRSNNKRLMRLFQHALDSRKSDEGNIDLHVSPDDVEAFTNDEHIQISNISFSSLDEQLIEKAVRIVEANLTELEFDVITLAKQLNISRSTLSRKIKTITGLTSIEFIRNIKMRHACNMLENPHITIAEVAMMLGYYDRKYFTSCFKEEIGMTPSEYQKSISNKRG